MIAVDVTDPTPPYEQIRRQLLGLIRSGALEAGRKLPSIRQLAGDLRIAPGTVARAYKELETAGLIESTRASGSRVRPGQQAETTLRDAAEQYATHALKSGVSLGEALSAVRAAWGVAAQLEHREAFQLHWESRADLSRWSYSRVTCCGSLTA